MPIFALPLAPNSAAPNSRLRLSSLPPSSRKRRRSPSPFDDDEEFLSDNDQVDESTNPLSLTPAEIAQYRLAGLKLNEHIPGKARDFPHRALPDKPARTERDRKGKGKEEEQDDEAEVKREQTTSEDEKKRTPGPGLRLQHLSVLTAILHKCLLAGDIPRASRAWAMLIRAEVNGHAMNLRGSGYWGIGAELLIRGNTAPPPKSPKADRNEKENEDEDEDEDEDKNSDDKEEEKEGRSESESVSDEDMDPSTERDEIDGEKRWGTRVGLKSAKNYYERLILQYPYKRQFPNAITALDFWPAMVGCEIYGIQWEQRAGLRRIAEEEEKNDDSDSGNSSESSEANDGSWEAEERRRKRIRHRKEEKLWRKRDHVRQTALVASERIAKRLDGLMNVPPYSDSHVLLRLRGMLGLYIGDLSVPARPDEDEESMDGEARNGGEDMERQMTLRSRWIEHERGKVKQTEERDRAMELFNRIVKDGGHVGVKLDEMIEDIDQDELSDVEP